MCMKGLMVNSIRYVAHLWCTYVCQRHVTTCTIH